MGGCASLVTVVHRFTHHRKSRLAIHLILEDGRGLFDVEVPVQLIRFNRVETTEQHRFLELIVRQIDVGAGFQRVFHSVAGVTIQRLLCREYMSPYF